MRILIDGSHFNVQPKSPTSSETLIFGQSFGAEFGSDSHGINVYGRQGGNSDLEFYNGRSGSVCNVLIDGNVEVDEVLTLKRIPGISDTSPLVIINDSPGGGTGVVYQSTAVNQGFLIAYMTAQSSVAWEEGVNGGVSNDFTIKPGSNGMTIKPTGDTSISGNLDAGIAQAQTSIKSYVNHAGYQGNIQIGPRWRSQGFIHFNTNYEVGLLSFAVKRDLYMYVGIEVCIFFTNQQQMLQMTDLRKTRN